MTSPVTLPPSSAAAVSATRVPPSTSPERCSTSNNECMGDDAEANARLLVANGTARARDAARIGRKNIVVDTDKARRLDAPAGFGLALYRQHLPPTKLTQLISNLEDIAGMSNKLDYHEMLSYGHKPTDPDYREQKDALEKAFDEADAQDDDDDGSSTDGDSSHSGDSAVSMTPLIECCESMTNQSSSLLPTQTSSDTDACSSPIGGDTADGYLSDDLDLSSSDASDSDSAASSQDDDSDASDSFDSDSPGDDSDDSYDYDGDDDY